MKLKKIKFQGYRNLKDFECEFDDSNIIAFIGNNGSGKSNVLEAIVQTFTIAKNIESIRDIDYIFDIEYSIDSYNYRIEHNGSAVYFYEDEKRNIKKLQQCLPKVIFTYYAGETKRLSNISKQIIDKRFNRELKQGDEIDFKMITDLSLKDFSLSFLTSYLYNADCFSTIKTMLGFDSVNEHRILFKLKKPYWAPESSSETNLWNAKEGSFVKNFYEKLLAYGEEEYGSGICVELDLSSEGIILGVNNLDLLKEIVNTPLELYMQLKAFMESDVLDDIIIYVNKNKNAFTLDYFSEGEKQLANLLMLLDLTKEYKALFILDEFDSYLHPNWQRKFVKMISDIDIRGQVLFSTHSAASISKMRKENVFIMKNGEVYLPSVDTFNRDISELLGEIMEVDKRPEEIERLIRNFRNAAMHLKEQEAKNYLEQLKVLLSKDDPFWVFAEHLMSRFGR